MCVCVCIYICRDRESKTVLVCLSERTVGDKREKENIKK
jgi:hypothetical protein